MELKLNIKENSIRKKRAISFFDQNKIEVDDKLVSGIDHSKFFQTRVGKYLNEPVSTLSNKNSS